MCQRFRHFIWFLSANSSRTSRSSSSLELHAVVRRRGVFPVLLSSSSSASKSGTHLSGIGEKMTDLLETEPEAPGYALQKPLVSPKKSHYLDQRPSGRVKKTATENGHHHQNQRNGLINGHYNSSSKGDSSAMPPKNDDWKPFLIGVAGGTASGKTSVCRKIMAKLGQERLSEQERRVVTISSDNFYRVLNPEERGRARNAEFNFDHPDALDFPLILDTVQKLLKGETARVPVYDFVTHSRLPQENILIYPADVILFEGILVFYFPDLRNLFQLKLFVDMDADTRVIRRMARDIKERGRDLQSVMHQYTYFVKPAFEEFCQPTKKYADVIIPRGAENDVAINLIVQHIKEHLLPIAESKNGSPRRSMQEEQPEKLLPNGLATNGH